MNRVKCATCGAVVGRDSVVKLIERCSACTSPKKKQVQTAASGFAKTKKGKAPDLPKPYDNISFRSGWERNFARFLCAAKKEWEYERTVFTFKEGKNGKPYTRKPFIYIPDFKETETGTLWEVKGYLRSEDRSKMKRFKLHYPEDFVKLKAVVSKGNKKAITFYKQMGIPLVFIEDIKTTWQPKIPAWE